MKQPRCCPDGSPEYPNKSSAHPAQIKAQLARAKRIRGQVDGVVRMLEDGRYCPDIVVQIQAIRSALGALQSAVLGKHLRDCVKEAFDSKNERLREAKIEELVKLFGKTS